MNLGYPLNQLQNLRFTFGGFAIPVYYPVMVGTMLIVAVLVLALHRRWTMWEVLWWALPLACVPGILRSAEKIWSIREWASWIVRGVIPGGALFLAPASSRIRSAFLSWVYPIAIAAALLGLAEIFGAPNPYWSGFDYRIQTTAQANNPFYRPRNEMILSEKPLGTQGDRIPYAASLVGFLPIGLWLARYSKKRRTLHLTGVAILTSLLLLAQVRAVWLATISALAVMPLLGLARGRTFLRIIGAVSIFMVIFLVLPWTRHSLWMRLNSFHATNESIGWRLDLLRTAVVLKKQWPVGVGFGEFASACRPYYTGRLTWIGTPDNEYVRWTIETGLFGLSALVLFIASLIRESLKEIAHLPAPEADFRRSLLAGWIAIAVSFIFFDGFYWGACNMTFWCFLGMFANSHDRSDRPGNVLDAQGL